MIRQNHSPLPRRGVPDIFANDMQPVEYFGENVRLRFIAAPTADKRNALRVVASIVVPAATYNRWVRMIARLPKEPV